MKNKKYLLKWAGILVAAIIIISANPGIVIADPPSLAEVSTTRWTTSNNIVNANETWSTSYLNNLVTELETAKLGTDNLTLIAERTLEVYKEYEFIPEDKTLDDLIEFGEEKYFEEYGQLPIYQDDVYCAWINGMARATFYCSRKLPLFCIVNSLDGGSLQYNSWVEDKSGEYHTWGGKHYWWSAAVWLGFWLPRVRRINDVFNKNFWGWTLSLMYEIEPPS